MSFISAKQGVLRFKEEEPEWIDALHLVIDYLSPIDSEESLP